MAMRERRTIIITAPQVDEFSSLTARGSSSPGIRLFEVLTKEAKKPGS
jgi:hypothetical protein